MYLLVGKVLWSLFFCKCGLIPRIVSLWKQRQALFTLSVYCALHHGAARKNRPPFSGFLFLFSEMPLKNLFLLNTFKKARENDAFVFLAFLESNLPFFLIKF